jgi:hypothetical protein
MPRHAIGPQPMTPAERMRRYRARRRNAHVDIPRDATDQAVVAALYRWLDGRGVRDPNNTFVINWVVPALFAYHRGEPVPDAATWAPWGTKAPRSASS